MATTKKYDIAVKVGEYTDRNGNTKARYENVGSVMEKDDGGKFIILKRTFNPAGVPNPENRDSLLLSLFEPRENEGGGERGGPPTTRPGRGESSRPAAPPADPFPDDSIPF